MAVDKGKVGQDFFLVHIHFLKVSTKSVPKSSLTLHTFGLSSRGLEWPLPERISIPGLASGQIAVIILRKKWMREIKLHGR